MDEFEKGKIDYNKRGELRNRHANKKISTDFRKSEKTHDDNFGTKTYEYKGYEQPKDIFEFFAKNTIVEWSHNIFKNIENGEIRSQIGTSYNKGKVQNYFFISVANYVIVSHRHSHPSGFLSKEDQRLHKQLNEEGNYVSTYYLKRGKYYPFEDKDKTFEGLGVVPHSY
jgi:hypothetical protein